MSNRTTGAQRYNARMDKIWETAMTIKRRDCKHHYLNEIDIWSNKKIKVCEYCGARK